MTEKEKKTQGGGRDSLSRGLRPQDGCGDKDRGQGEEWRETTVWVRGNVFCDPCLIHFSYFRTGKDMSEYMWAYPKGHLKNIQLTSSFLSHSSRFDMIGLWTRVVWTAILCMLGCFCRKLIFTMTTIFFFIFVCDGLWDVLESQDAINIHRVGVFESGCLNKGVSRHVNDFTEILFLFTHYGH